ncbi:MAG: helix-turn-helix transcriptional regulator, partial [Kurthia sp.]|nr:helix-turn-helix transcriptional regulator [Kurthia sp.]
MLNYSQIIKNERIKQNMTQQALAKGICSTSYLSKIEKEHVIPR